MSEMSYLEKLLDGVEVEWKAVGDIAGYSTTKVDADKLDATSFVGVDNLLADKGGRIDATYQPNTARLTAYEPGDILLGNIRPYLKKVWMAENNGGCSGDVLAIRILADCKKIISPEYLYYALSSDSFFSYSMQHAKGAKMPRGSKDAILNYQIPIPCPSAPEKSLAIQSEIVRILDKFTALTAELTAELAMRKKQYNYYRDQLLSFEEGEVEWKTLGDIGDVRMCKRILKNETLPEGDVPFYKIGTFGKKANAFISRDVFEAYKNKYSFPKKGDVLISASGTIGRTVIYDGEPAYFQDSNIVWLENDESIVTNKYLWHFYKIAKWAVSEGGTIDRLYNDNIRKTKIIVPYPSDPSKSLAEQNRVVAILEKFDALTSSISEGLPREIELRQKQYEYYRDLLFSFPKPETASN
ncbi:restriction endonuclease subunit S [Salmonella enterica]|nr:restriction endonuclease subunit S [Salmonella enterica]EAZ6132734.1 restriction endonuclease subunit S [Salmonella enterica]EBA8747351.1 restriction endonuclease subunit S [Salmonella enterica]EBA8800053.1 restriction endonuclease subunit S [Salmonella enterica]EBC5108707.1 restriction endonuclease subunit S [Salmonella enterica]